VRAAWWQEPQDEVVDGFLVDLAIPEVSLQSVEGFRISGDGKLRFDPRVGFWKGRSNRLGGQSNRLGPSR
jgi:hypothetical protein